jgi:hypothetical protein
MAIIPSAKYPGQVASDPTNYPRGKARNVTVSGDGTGTPLEKDWVNDLWGFQQAMLYSVGFTPSGNPDTALDSQYLQALIALFAPHNNYIVATGNGHGPLTTATTSTTYVSISGADISIPNAAIGDILVGQYLLGVSMTSGTAYVNLLMNDGASVDAEHFTYEFSAPSPIKRTLPFHHVVTAAGTAAIVPQLKIDSGGTTATIGSYYMGNNLFCTYQLIRP